MPKAAKRSVMLAVSPVAALAAILVISGGFGIEPNALPGSDRGMPGGCGKRPRSGMAGAEPCFTK